MHVAHEVEELIGEGMGEAEADGDADESRAPVDGQFPVGTIIVKTASSGGFVHLVAIGRKRRGFDRRNGNWEFVEYTRARW